MQGMFRKKRQVMVVARRNYIQWMKFIRKSDYFQTSAYIKKIRIKFTPMIRLIFISLCLTGAIITKGQEKLKVVKPVHFLQLDLSMEGENKYEKQKKLFFGAMEKMEKGISESALSREEREAINNYNEVMGYWDAVGDGCSWYCGGGPISVSASSYLSPQGQNTYDPSKLHDLNYKTAWVEGVEGNGIGETIEFSFSPTSPRITTIKIANGYVKSLSTWENNGRVKRLKMYVDDNPVAFLELLDSRSVQSFEFPPLGNSPENWDNLTNAPAWKLKFEIIEVFPGKKFKDTAISEIFFDGLDVHCFAEGTRVTMKEGGFKSIELIQPGDSILSFDSNTGLFKLARVEKVAVAIHHKMIRYVFEDNISLLGTREHPFWIKDKGWGSLYPEKSKGYEGMERILPLKEGDYIATNQVPSGLKLLHVEEITGHFTMYTITQLSWGDGFMVEGKVVAVEKIRNWEKNESAE
jgi:hypothetical protein